jgi:hypothetical protein
MMKGNLKKWNLWTWRSSKKDEKILLNVPAEWLALLPRTRDLSGSNPVSETGYPD